MLTFQREKLSVLLRHARNTVPFYKNRLGVVFRSDGSINWNKWHQLPILKRSDLRDSFKAMQTTALPKELGQIGQFSSSGSSGTPITISINGRASLASAATKHRGYTWHGVDWSENICAWMGDQRSGDLQNDIQVGPWGPIWDEASKEGQQLEISRHASDDQVLDFIKRENITYLAGRPKSMQQLALKAIKRGEYIPMSKILPFGTSIEEDVREDCRQAFGCEFVERYSSKEGQSMAQQCPENEYLHINAEILKLEILDENDMPCKIGEMGRVVITPFFAMAQPLIRYEIGDMAIYGEPCSCGRTLPVLAKVAGRMGNLFRFPGGIVIAPSVPWSLHRQLLNSNSWQFAQVGPLHVEVRYVPIDDEAPAQETALAEIVREVVHKDLTVSFKRLDSIPTRVGGKHMTFVCELTKAELEAVSA